MATLKDKRISISINGETIEGVIVNASHQIVEVVIISPEWCRGVMGYNLNPKQNTRQELIQFGERIFENLYKMCLYIRQHADDVKAFEAEYNNRYQRLTPLEQNRLIYHYIGEWLSDDVEIYTPTRVINRICGTNLMERSRVISNCNKLK